MYLYLGRVGNGYRWAFWGGGRHVYLYERSRETRWKTRYLGKTPLAGLPRAAKLALLRAVASVFRDFFETLGRLAAAHHKAHLLAREYREELEALGLLEDDG